MQFWETINKRKSSLDGGRKKHCMIPVFRGILILDGQESQRSPHDDGETERPKRPSSVSPVRREGWGKQEASCQNRPT